MNFLYYIFIAIFLTTTLEATLLKEIGTFKNSLQALSSHLNKMKTLPTTDKDKVSTPIEIIKNQQKIKDITEFKVDLKHYIDKLITTKNETILVKDFSDKNVQVFFEKFLDALTYNELLQDLGLEKSEWDDEKKFSEWEQIATLFQSIFREIDKSLTDETLPEQYK